MRSLHLIFGLVLTAGPVIASATEARPALAALSEGDRRIVADWLALDCSVGDPLAEEMARGGAALEASLWEAYELGPTDAHREALKASLPRAWAERRAWLAREDTKVVGLDVAARLGATTEDDYRAAQLRKQENRYRNAALAGLGRVCTDESRWRLESIAGDESSPSRAAAREALRRSGDCARQRD